MNKGWALPPLSTVYIRGFMKGLGFRGFGFRVKGFRVKGCRVKGFRV